MNSNGSNLHIWNSYPSIYQILNHRQWFLTKWLHAFYANLLVTRTNRSDVRAFNTLFACLSNPSLPSYSIILSALAKNNTHNFNRALWEHWIKSREPGLRKVLLSKAPVLVPNEARIISHLLVGKTEPLLKMNGEALKILVCACLDSDSQISSTARQVCHSLSTQEQKNVFCKVWAETRQPTLTELLVTSQFTVNKPLQLFLLTHLKLNKLEILASLKNNWLPELLSFLQDADPEIHSRAEFLLRSLPSQNIIDDFCNLLITSENLPGNRIALTCGYSPSKIEDQAIFFLITGQDQKYTDLDFDHRIARAIYTTAAATLRDRIALAVQRSGKAEFLSILEKPAASAAQRTSEELDLLVSLFTQHSQWQELWDLTTELSLWKSLSVFSTLRTAQWQPSDEELCVHWEQICEIISSIDPEKTQIAVDETWPAYPLALLKVRGRLNDIAFAPSRPILALGTAARSVILWNYQTASIEKTITGFEHSVSQVEFSPNGDLFIGERSNDNRIPCKVYKYSEDTLQTWFQAPSSIAHLDVTESQILVSLRTGKIYSISTTDPTQTEHLTLPEYARVIRVSPDSQYALAIHRNINLLSIPLPRSAQPVTVETTYSAGTYTKSVVHAAAFAADQSYFLLGQTNGQIVKYFFKTFRPPTCSSQKIAEMSSGIIGIQALPAYNCFLALAEDGSMFWLNKDTLKLTRQQQASTERVTSLHITPDNSCLAIGSANGNLSFWSTLSGNIPVWFSVPLSKLTLNDLSAMQTVNNTLSLNSPVKTGVALLITRLRYRHQTDIQITQPASILPGEFDIVIESNPASVPAV